MHSRSNAPGNLQRQAIILSILLTLGLGVLVDTVSATPEDLSNGVYIAHYAPNLVYTTNPPEGGWGEALQNSEDAIHACEDQLNRLDGPGDHYMWFIIR